LLESYAPIGGVGLNMRAKYMRASMSSGATLY